MDVLAVAQEDAEAKRLAVLVDALLRRLRPDAEVEVEVGLERRVPRGLPAHALPVGLELLDRGARDEREGRVAGAQVGEVADLVDGHGAAVAARLLVQPEPEVVAKQLPAALEEAHQRRLTDRAGGDRLRGDPAPP